MAVSKIQAFGLPLTCGVGLAFTETDIETVESQPKLFDSVIVMVAVPELFQNTLIVSATADPINIPPATFHV